MDAAVYVRPCDGGLLWGVYEDEPRFFDMAEFPPGFEIKDMPLDNGVLRGAAEEVAAQLPILAAPAVRDSRGGIPTIIPDGQPILGPTPSVAVFFFASGCNVAGFSISPAL